MRRRDLIKAIGGSTIAWPLAARAQQSSGKKRVGVLMAWAESDPAAQSWFAAFREGITKLGWTEGSNLDIELRWGAGNADKIGAWARELVGLRPDAILGLSTPVVGALARETRTIPIVFALVSDPIGNGFAANLTHPGGNITGFTNIESTMGGKWVELLKEVAPRIARVKLLFNPSTAAPIEFFMPSIQAAAATFDFQVSAAPVHAKEEIEGIFAAQARDPGGGLIVMPDPFNTANRDMLVSLAARYGIPVIYSVTDIAKSGGLIAYGVDIVASFHQTAGYIDRILNGAKPADLPIQNPTKFNLVINLKTAKSQAVSIPQTLLATADEVIE